MFFRNDNKDNAFDRQVFNISTIETLAEAKDKDFYTKFFTAANITKWVGLTGQALSGLTEFIFFFLAVGGKYPVFQQVNVLPILTGLFMVFVFEYLGIRVYLVRIVRQVVNKDFKKEIKAPGPTATDEVIKKVSPQKIALFVLNIIFCGSILFANFYTSITGQGVTFIDLKSNVDNSDTLTKIDNQLLAEIDTLTARTARNNRKLSKQAENDKKTIEASYKPVIKSLNAAKWTTKDRNKQDAVNDEIRATNQSKLNELKTITDTLNARTAANMALLNEAIKTAKSNATIKKDAVKNKEGSTLDIYAMFDNFSLLFLIVFMTLGILAIIYREIYISGSQQKVELTEVKKRPVLIFALLFGLYMKAYHIFYWLVVKIVGSKAFNYSKIMQTKEDYLSTNVSSNNALQAISNYFKTDQQTPVQVSAYGQNKATANNANSSANQKVSTDLEAKQKALSKYNLGTVASWYKRSDYVKKSESKTEKGKQNNRTKYDNAKADLSAFGVQFIENNNHVTIKV